MDASAPAFDLPAPHMQSEGKAREYLEALRWPNGPVCPHCGIEGAHYALKGASHRPGLMKCKDCRRQFSVTVGTLFAGSRIPLHKWLMAMHLMRAGEHIPILRLHRMLGITYKSAWFMTRRIREAMKSDGIGLMAAGRPHRSPIEEEPKKNRPREGPVEVHLPTFKVRSRNAR